MSQGLAAAAVAAVLEAAPLLAAPAPPNAAITSLGSPAPDPGENGSSETSIQLLYLDYIHV